MYYYLYVYTIYTLIPNTISPPAAIIIIIIVEYISADISDVILVQRTYKTMMVVNTIYNALSFVYAILNNYVYTWILEWKFKQN
jgi:hypothetical protein